MNTTLITGASSGIGRAGFYLLPAMGVLLTAIAHSTLAQPSTNPARGFQNSCHQIVVMGAVRKPVRLDAHRALRLLDALAMAGGPPHQVGKTIRVIHSCKLSSGGQPRTESRDVDEYDLADVLRGRKKGNPEVKAGDVVVVSIADLVVVIGNVKKTNSANGMTLIGNVKHAEIVFVNGITLMQAVELGGGVERNSEMVRVQIHRAAVAGTDPIIVNLKEIKERRTEDVRLQPWDVIDISDELGRFQRLKPSNIFWDPPLMPRKDSSYS